MPRQLIENIKQLYVGKKINEADTRFKIIDSILLEILKWEKSPLMLEVIQKGTRADYVLYGKNQRPILIIESKKAGKYFDLPTNVNSGGNFQRIAVEKLLTDKNLKEAIMQVKEYCEDLGANYACVSNGFVWVFFCLFSRHGGWKSLPAFVIRDLDFFWENQNLAENLFSYHNIVNNSSLKNNIGVSRQNFPEIFYPKSSITAYDMPVNSNHFAGYFNALSRKFLGNIPMEDDDFFESCYVTNKGHFDDLQKNMHGIIYDSLTPFFKNLGVKNFYENKRNAGDFVTQIEDLMRRENLDNVMILFGGRGSGKSTFLKRLIKHLKPKIIDSSITCLVDLIDSSQNSNELSVEIWTKVLESIDKDHLLNNSRDNLIKLFADKYKIFKKQVLDGYIQFSEEYNKQLTGFIQDMLKDTKYCCEVISKYWKAYNKGLIIVLDNLDQLRPELQDICFLTATELSRKLSCLVVISMREERFFNAKSKGVLDAYVNPGFHITSPVIPEVIAKRLSYVLNQLNKNSDLKQELGISDSTTFQTLKNFLVICVKQVTTNDSDLAKFLRFTTHGDVRQALEFFTGFIQSGYTNVKEMASDGTYWNFRSHQVIKPMMIPSRFFYDERQSRMPNLYQLRNEVNSSHFSGLRILNVLNNRSYDKGSAGLIDAKYLIQLFESVYDLKEDCIKHLDIFLTKGIIEANNRLEEFSENVDQIKLTSFGKYMLDDLAFDFTYLDLISLDCGIFDEALNNFMIASGNRELELYHEKKFFERITVRLNKVERFVEYLEKQEEKEFEDLGLGDNEVRFSKKMRQQFDDEKKIVLKSAKSNSYQKGDNLEIPFEEPGL